MREVGMVRDVMRYPVKSMLGESLEAATLGEDGIPGDRAFGVRDEARGDFFVGKRSAALMSCSASFPGGFEAGAVPEIALPDGQAFPADAPDAAARLTGMLGRDVSVWPAGPEARQSESQEEIAADDMVAMMARAPGEAMPDFSNPPPELLEVQARNGPFFDAFPLLLLTSRSLESIAATQEDAAIDARRFRPNLLIETNESGAFPEQDWIGRRIRIGEVVLSIHLACVRCVMVTHAFADLPKDPGIMRALVRENEGHLGVYAIVEEGGRVRRGDSVSLLA